MALYAFDGTGNEDEERDSSVLEFFRAYDDPHKNDDPDRPRGSLYLKGIGTRARTETGETLAEALGIGGHRRVNQALARLQRNRDAGDPHVDIIGFSRGAALAISFANRIAETFTTAVEIRFVGVWDIVGQFGAPGEHINAGHDLSMPARVRRCCHAMALDESRAFFPLTRLSRPGGDPRLIELWFRGVHSDIGGGNGNLGMNWIALNWMFEAARREGVPLVAEIVTANLLHRALAQQISDHKLDLEHRRKIWPTDMLHASVKLGPGVPGRAHNDPQSILARMGDDGQVTRV